MISKGLMKKTIKLVAVGFPLFISAQAYSSSLTLDQSKTALAVLTNKEGLAAGLAHRHIIVAQNVRGTLTAVAQAGSLLPVSGAAQLEFRVEDMIVDQTSAADKIVPVLESNHSWNSKSDKIEPSNSEKVRENMLAEDQLDAKKYPVIKGSGTFSSCTALDAARANCDLELQITIKGVSVTRKAQLLVVSSGDGLTASFHLPLKFTDFGIKPYTAMMGAIRVSNEIVIAGQLQATK
jgi:hypothetical protein